MQWVAIMVGGFLIVGLRRSTRHSWLLVVAVVTAVLAVWFTQMGPR